MRAGKLAFDTFSVLRKFTSGAWRAIIAGVAGAAVTALNAGRVVRGTVAELRSHSSKNQSKKTGEVVVMKKSTWVALLVALATVAGVLGALYVYVLRRERELDEYEQLLFSEDFNDDLPEQQDDPAVESEPETP